MSNVKLADKFDVVLETPRLVQELVLKMPEYSNMLEVIHANLPEIKKSTENFHKTQSQFMDNMLTVSHPTPLRNVRQILAEMNKTQMAIQDAYIKCSRKEIEIDMKMEELEKEQDNNKKKLLQLDILELTTHLENNKSAIGGAIRKLTNYSVQYEQILAAHNLQNFSEEDFEKEEEKYHIMKAFDQGTTAARSRNGIVDEGNLIYFTQIGINAGAAQLCISGYLAEEAKLVKDNKEPSHEMYLSFLELMAERYKNSAKEYSKFKGLSEDYTKVALLTKREKTD